MYDADTKSYAVWEPADVEKLIERLKEALRESEKQSVNPMGVNNGER